MQTKLLAILLAGVFVFSGCTLFDFGDDSEDSDTSTNSSSSNSSTPIPIATAFSNTGDEEAFVADITSTDADGNVSEARMEFQKPDVTRFVVESDEGTAETIFTPDGTYLRKDNGPWIKNETTAEAPLPTVQYNTADIQSSITDPDVTLTELPDEACGALQCHVYQGVTTDNTETTIWFDTQDLLLRKVQTKQMSGDAVIQESIIEYSYDEVAIEIPDDSEIESIIPAIPTPDAIEDLQDSLN